MNTIFILETICVVLLSIFYVIYYIKIKNNVNNVEIIDEAKYLWYNEMILLVMFIIYITSPIVGRHISFKLDILMGIIVGIALMTIIVVAVIGFGNMVMNKKRNLKAKEYRKLNNEALKKYLIVVGICIFVIYPVLYLSIYFLFK